MLTRGKIMSWAQKNDCNSNIAKSYILNNILVLFVGFVVVFVLVVCLFVFLWGWFVGCSFGFVFFIHWNDVGKNQPRCSWGFISPQGFPWKMGATYRRPRDTAGRCPPVERAARCTIWFQELLLKCYCDCWSFTFLEFTQLRRSWGGNTVTSGSLFCPCLFACKIAFISLVVILPWILQRKYLHSLYYFASNF